MKKALLGSIVLGSSVLLSACTWQPTAQFSTTDEEILQQTQAELDGATARASAKPGAMVVKPSPNVDAAKKVDPAMLKKNEQLMKEETESAGE